MKKEEWGPIIWKLLHCLTIKIKEDSFPKKKNELINTILSIFSNLPCPHCSSHALSLSKRLNITNINDKNNLIKALYIIHNLVNKKLKKKELSYDIIETYNNYNTKEVVVDYVNAINKSNYSERMMLYNFKKKQFINIFTKFIKANIDIFHD